MSDDPFLRALQTERSKLLKELAASAIYRRLKVVEAAMEIYQAPTEWVADAEREINRQIAMKTPRSGTVASSVIDIAERYLRSIGRRAQTPAIAVEVQKAGILVEAANVIATVSSYLSSAKDKFDNVRGEGYGLVEWLGVSPQQMRDVGALPPNALVGGEVKTADPVEGPAA
jgi:hypothetical protein